jgi:hypothetical protein
LRRSSSDLRRDGRDTKRILPSVNLRFVTLSLPLYFQELLSGLLYHMDSSRHHNNPAGEPPHDVLPEIHSSRRGTRQTLSFPVWLRNEEPRSIWEEETETQVVSRYGAGLRCRHFVQPDTIVVILRRDNGQRAQARARYCRYNSDGVRELGIEFIGKDNFWDLEWTPSKTVKQTKQVMQDSALESGTSGILADERTETASRAGGYRIEKRRTQDSQAVVDGAQALPSADAISRRAYAIYLARGGVGGDGLGDWLQAECELKEQHRKDESN